MRALAGKLERRDYSYPASARRLYDLLLAPVAATIDRYRVVCIVPHDVLWQLPFNTLEESDGHPVIERLAIFYAPSLAMLRAAAHKRNRALPSNDLLAFGNPTVGDRTKVRAKAVYFGASLGPLPDAEAEVRALAALYRPERAHFFTRDKAREATFKSEAPRFRVLHLAMHAILDDRAPMFSALVMSTSASDSHEDGLLEAGEILRMKLSADIAVLSACDTARGDIGSGEGVIGISWAFLVAGCPTTVVSQWAVESAATAQLMVEFHKQLLAGRSKADALRQAQLKLRKNPRYAHPFYWASFVVVGAGT